MQERHIQALLTHYFQALGDHQCHGDMFEQHDKSSPSTIQKHGYENADFNLSPDLINRVNNLGLT